MIILIDNYDSFTFNVYHYLSELGILHRILQLENHIGLEIYNKKNQEWEFHDVHFNDAINELVKLD